MSPAKVRAAIDNGPYSAAEALEAGLIDSVKHRQEFIADIKRVHGEDVEIVTDYGKKDPFDIPDDNLKRSELAWELVELFGELPIEQINEVLAKNVPLETLEFFASYAEDFGTSEGISGKTLKRLPNLLLLGYLLRVLEDRLIEGESFDS